MASNPFLLAPLPHMNLPAPLLPLVPLAYNLLWAWKPKIAAPFAFLAGSGWDANPNPVAVLRQPYDYKTLARDSTFLQVLNEAVNESQAYGMSPAPLERRLPENSYVAYFCAEFGLTEVLPIYSGGLGVLAGDHTKEASDQGLPFVGVGLFYRQGFFKQYVAPPGRQEHGYQTLVPGELPLRAVLDPKTQKPLRVPVVLGVRTVWLAVWHVAVGRAHLLLLDAHVPVNRPEDMAITDALYVSGREMRLLQEVVLGVGGAKALAMLGVDPHVWHLNEGHSAFMLVERIRHAMANLGLDFETALAQVTQKTVFTIHTPVPAGNERFDNTLVESLLPPLLEGTPLHPHAVLNLGRGLEGDNNHFDMTAFCLRMSRCANGVSQLHGTTAQATWRGVSHGPMGGITNGIHLGTWVAGTIQSYLENQGIKGGATPGPQQLGALWAAHLEKKAILIEELKSRLQHQWARHGWAPDGLKQVRDGLQSHAFFIGFARRFAGYKRASLLFTNGKRLEKILKDPHRPVHIVFAGKAHPADLEGQEIIAQVFQKTLSSKFQGYVYFVEDYNMALGRALVQGVDLWLNNPLRPLEASGTSGMKAAANGVPNLSTLDGWWDEAWDGTNGWAIGDRTVDPDPKVQAKNDAKNLYDLLEKTVVPLFFERGTDGLPRGYLAVMARALATGQGAFSTQRMLEQYVDQFYAPPFSS